MTGDVTKEGGLTLSERILRMRVRRFLAIMIGLGLIEGVLTALVAHEINDWPLEEHGWWLLAAALALGAGLVWLQGIRDLGRATRIGALEVEAIAAEARARTVLGDSLDPILETLCFQISKKVTVMGNDAGSLQSGVLASSAALIGPDRSRANFYAYVTGTTPNGRTVRELRLKGHIGRRSGRPVFSFDNPDGRYAIMCITKDLNFGVADVINDPPVWFNGAVHGGKYRSFIAVPVRCTGHRAFGMLTVDSPEANAFAESDFDLLRVYARILAISLMAMKRLDHQDGADSAG